MLAPRRRFWGPRLFLCWSQFFCSVLVWKWNHVGPYFQRLDLQTFLKISHCSIFVQVMKCRFSKKLLSSIALFFPQDLPEGREVGFQDRGQHRAKMGQVGASMGSRHHNLEPRWAQGPLTWAILAPRGGVQGDVGSQKRFLVAMLAPSWVCGGRVGANLSQVHPKTPNLEPR